MPDLTIAEAAAELGVKESWVRDRIKARLLPHHRYGRHVRFTPADLAEIRATTAEPVRPPVRLRPAAVIPLRPEATPDKPGPHTPPPPRNPAKLPRPIPPKTDPKTDPPKKTRAA